MQMQRKLSTTFIIKLIAFATAEPNHPQKCQQETKDIKSHVFIPPLSPLQCIVAQFCRNVSNYCEAVLKVRVTSCVVEDDFKTFCFSLLFCERMDQFKFQIARVLSSRVLDYQSTRALEKEYYVGV